MARFANRQHGAILAVLAIVLCAMSTVGAAELALAIAPVALLVSSLLGGCYPGEATLAWMAAKVGGHLRSCDGRVPTRPAVPRVSLTHGGLLIARSLCGRAPPLPVR